jgi:hypothetical protein
MKLRTNRRGNTRHDNTAIIANNCNNLFVAILAAGFASSDCRTN